MCLPLILLLLAAMPVGLHAQSHEACGHAGDGGAMHYCFHARIDHRSILVVDHYEEGRRMAQDRILITAIDLNTWMIDTTDAALRMRCMDGARCVERESFRDGLLRRSAQYDLLAGGAPGDVLSRLEDVERMVREQISLLMDAAGVTR